MSVPLLVSRMKSRSITQSITGFTTVELIMVVVLIGILSVVVAPRLLNQSEVASTVYQNRAISILRNIQTRAMQDTRGEAPYVGQPSLSFCYQVNFLNTQFGIPANSFITESHNNDSVVQTRNRNAVEATCSKSIIDTNDPAELFYVTNMDRKSVVVTATASRQSLSELDRPAITSIRFDKLGRAVGLGVNNLGQDAEIPCSGIDSPGGCYVTFSGASDATVCVETQGYIYACGS